MKLILHYLLIGSLIQSIVYSAITTKRVHREKPDRELFIFGDAKEKLKQQLAENQHENMLMMMKMMKRQEDVKRISGLINQFQSLLDSLAASVSSSLINFSQLISS